MTQQLGACVRSLRDLHGATRMHPQRQFWKPIRPACMQREQRGPSHFLPLVSATLQPSTSGLPGLQSDVQWPSEMTALPLIRVVERLFTQSLRYTEQL